MNITKNITIDQLKSLTTKENAEKVLSELNLYYKKNKIWETLQNNYNYEVFLKIFRKIALGNGGKYDTQLVPELLVRRDILIQEYKEKYPNDRNIQWAFNMDGFDDFRKKYTFGKISYEDYINGVKKHTLAASISDITSRVTEIIIVSNNEKVFPTLKNKGGIDYVYMGKEWDLKNSKSLGKLFFDWCKTHQKTPLEEAVSNPTQVIKCLYEGQSESRFGCEPRHLIVNLNDEILSNEKLIEKLSYVNLEDEKEITFTNKKTGKIHTTTALITYI
jgi:hypothetical protein